MNNVLTILFAATFLMPLCGKCADGDKWIVNLVCQHINFSINPVSSTDKISITAQKSQPVFRLIRTTDGRSVYNNEMYFKPGYGYEKILDLGIDVDQDFPVAFDQFGQTGGTFHITRGIGSRNGTIKCANSPVGPFSGGFYIIELTGVLVEKTGKIFGTLTSSEPVNGETIYMVLGDGKGQSSFWKYAGRTYVSAFYNAGFQVTLDPNDPATSPYGSFWGSAIRIPSGQSGLGLSVQISDKPSGPWITVLPITNSLPKIYTNQFYRIVLK